MSGKNDSINRQAAIDAMTNTLWHYPNECYRNLNEYEFAKGLAEIGLKSVPSAQPENQVHLCDSCRHVYPECPSGKDDVIFGNGKGNDNICACNKYEPSTQPEPRWIPCSERLPEDSQFVLMTIRRMDEHYNHEPFISVGYISWNQSAWWCAHDGDCKLNDVRVDAWMPLPEPWKERREE